MLTFKTAVDFKQNGTLGLIIGTLDYLVKESFIWFLNYEDKKYFVEVPVGYKTNLCSIPKFLRIFFDRERVSGILHDYLCETKKKCYIEDGLKFYVPVGYIETQVIYYEALQVEGVSKTEAMIQFIGLILFCWIIFYNIKTKIKNLITKIKLYF